MHIPHTYPAEVWTKYVALAVLLQGWIPDVAADGDLLGFVKRYRTHNGVHTRTRSMVQQIGACFALDSTRVDM